MRQIEVRTQAELDKAIKSQKPGDLIVCLGGSIFCPLIVSGSASVVARESASVVARESASVVARESARVEARGSARVVAWESASVEARGSARVVAWGSARVEARENASVEASKYVSIHRHDKRATVKGGVLIDVPNPADLSPQEWCDYYGVKVTRGTAYLFKAVDDDYSTSYARRRDIFYTPGSSPKCDDFNKRQECGGGLHAAPSPTMALDYNPNATRFVCVPVRLAEIVVVGDKVKVPRVAGKVFEVDCFGDRLDAA